MRAAIDDPDPVVIFEGSDFVSAPAFSPDGRRLAFTVWRHPDMPWDAAELHVAPIRRDGTLAGYGGGVRRKQFLLDLERAGKAKERAEQGLDLKAEEESFRRAEIKLKRAIARIQVHGRSQH